MRLCQLVRGQQYVNSQKSLASCEYFTYFSDDAWFLVDATGIVESSDQQHASSQALHVGWCSCYVDSLELPDTCGYFTYYADDARACQAATGIVAGSGHQHILSL